MRVLLHKSISGWPNPELYRLKRMLNVITSTFQVRPRSETRCLKDVLAGIGYPWDDSIGNQLVALVLMRDFLPIEPVGRFIDKSLKSLINVLLLYAPIKVSTIVYCATQIKMARNVFDQVQLESFHRVNALVALNQKFDIPSRLSDSEIQSSQSAPCFECGHFMEQRYTVYKHSTVPNVRRVVREFTSCRCLPQTSQEISSNSHDPISPSL